MDVQTIIGDVLTFLTLAAAVVAVIYARDSARAARDTVGPMQAMAVDLAVTAETMKANLALAEQNRQEERLYQELARRERLMGILKSIWLVLDRQSRAGVPASGRIAYSRDAAGEVDALLYQLRAALAVFGQHEFPNCRRLADSSGMSVSGTIVDEAEQEVQVSLDSLRQALNALLIN